MMVAIYLLLLLCFFFPGFARSTTWRVTLRGAGGGVMVLARSPRLQYPSLARGELFTDLSSHITMLVFKTITGMLKCRPDVTRDPCSRTSSLLSTAVFELYHSLLCFRLLNPLLCSLSSGPWLFAVQAVLLHLAVWGESGGNL